MMKTDKLSRKSVHITSEKNQMNDEFNDNNSHVLKIENMKTREDINQWIITKIKHFKEWYQPVDFGDGIIADVTVPPLWKPAPELNLERGVAKWNFIVKRNMPDLQNKRVLDLGCNNGIMSIMIAREGATEVLGIDRNETIFQKSNKNLPVQNIVEQASFVKKAFELKEGIKLPITYYPCDIAEIDKLNLGKFDLIISLCVVYHEFDKMPKIIEMLAKMTDHLILQTNLKHSGDLAKWADISTHVKLLQDAGFSKIIIDAPKDYYMPIIIGEK